MKQIRFEVSKAGKVEMVPIGYQGQSCKQATKPFEKLGFKLQEQDLPELYLEEKQDQYLTGSN